MNTNSDTQPTDIDLPSALAISRILALTADPRLMTTLGGAVGLAVFVIRRCDADDQCQMSSREYAEIAGLHVNSIRKYFDLLKEAGIVETSDSSSKGFTVRIVGDLADPPERLAPVRDLLDRAGRLVSASRTVMDETCRRIEAEMEVVANELK